MKIMLPPGPDGKTHPDFFISRHEVFGIRPKWRPMSPQHVMEFPIKEFHGQFFTQAAAAIAFWWNKAIDSVLSEKQTGSVEYATRIFETKKQYKIWSSIAEGSDAYNTAEIVAYKEAGK